MYTSHPFCLLKLWQALVLTCLFGAPSGVLARHDIAVKTTESFSAPPSDPCDNPVIINNITVQHTLCGISTGSISVSIEGGNAGCIFQWTPAVSTSATASQLAAGAYHLKITRQGNSACTTDTTIIVNNDNGPAVDVVEVLPSNCLASNGKATLWPTSLFYVWDNGEIGAVNDGLLSICYYVTATEPGSGCYSVVKVCVPNENPLVASAQIVHPAKCGKSNGIVQITVTGGSGQYSYSLGPGATLTGLAAGDYVCVVSDNNSGCTAEVSFTVPDAPVEATVNITPYNISCPGGGTGFVGGAANGFVLALRILADTTGGFDGGAGGERVGVVTLRGVGGSDSVAAHADGTERGTDCAYGVPGVVSGGGGDAAADAGTLAGVFQYWWGDCPGTGWSGSGMGCIEGLAL